MEIIHEIVSDRTETVAVIKYKEEAERKSENNVEENVMPVVEQTKIENSGGDEETKADVSFDKNELSDELDSSFDSGRLQIVTSNSDENSTDIKKLEPSNSKSIETAESVDSLSPISTETAKPMDPPTANQSVATMTDTDSETSDSVALTVNADSIAVEEVPDTSVTKKCNPSVTFLRVESGPSQFSQSRHSTSSEASLASKFPVLK